MDRNPDITCEDVIEVITDHDGSYLDVTCGAPAKTVQIVSAVDGQFPDDITPLCPRHAAEYEAEGADFHPSVEEYMVARQHFVLQYTAPDTKSMRALGVVGQKVTAVALGHGGVRLIEKTRYAYESPTQWGYRFGVAVNARESGFYEALTSMIEEHVAATKASHTNGVNAEV